MFKTIKFKLFFVCLIFTTIILITSVIYLYFFSHRERSFNYISLINKLSTQSNSLYKYEQDFINYDSKKATYHFTHHSQFIAKHQKLISSIYLEIDSLLITGNISDTAIQSRLYHITNEIKDYNITFSKLIKKINQRGIQIYGLEGKLLMCKIKLTQYSTWLEKDLMSEIRHNEKDYFITKDSIFVFNTEYIISQIQEDLKVKKIPADIKEKLISSLDNYLSAFIEIVNIEKEIGYTMDNGLKGELIDHNNNIRNIMEIIEAKTLQYERKLTNDFKIIYFIILSTTVCLGLILSYLFSILLTRPIRKISAYIDIIIESNFSENIEEVKINSNDEVGNLAKSISILRRKIQSYIKEVRQNTLEIQARNINIKKSELNFRSTFEQAAVGIAHVDLNGNWIRVNKKLSEMLKYDPIHLMNKNPLEITNQEDKFIDTTEMKKLLNENILHYNIEKRLIDHSGKDIWANITVSVKHDTKNNPEYLIWIIQDISKRKKTEQELVFKNKELDTFFYKVSHDLKGPVASLKGLIKISKIQLKDPLAIEYFENVEKTTIRLHEIISNLIELTKLKEGEITSHEINIEKMIRTCLAGINHIHGFEKIKFNFHNISKNTLYTDVRHLRSIIHNLLENAIKYSSFNKNSYINISISDHKKGVLIIIEDNGIGIPEKFLAKIFDMFFRATVSSQGSGLGLYLVKNAVDRLNGSIEVSSEESIGTSFYLYIPHIETKEIERILS